MDKDVAVDAQTKGRSVLLSLFVVVILCACKESSIQTQRQASIPPQSEDFAGFGPATNGGRLTNIIAELGDPISSRKFGGGTNVHDFMIDQSPQVPKGLAGVTLFEKNGVVSFVRPITGDPAPFTKQQRVAAKKIVPREVLIRIGDVTLTVVPTAAAPSEMNQESQNQLVLRALFDLNDEDARKLQLFTSTNLGNLVRFYLEQEFVFEFQLFEEIKTNTISLKFEKPGVPFEKLYKVRPAK